MKRRDEGRNIRRIVETIIVTVLQRESNHRILLKYEETETIYIANSLLFEEDNNVVSALKRFVFGVLISYNN